MRRSIYLWVALLLLFQSIEVEAQRRRGLQGTLHEIDRQAALAPEADYYVSSTGSDSNNGTSLATAWASMTPVQTLLESLPDGDSVNVAVMAGTYEADIHSGTTYTPASKTDFVIRCYGKVIFDNSAYVGTGNNNGFNAGGGANFHLWLYGNPDHGERTEIDGGLIAESNNGLGASESGNLHVFDVEVYGYQDGVSSHNTSYIEAKRIYAHGNSKSGYAMVNSSTYQFDSCIFEGVDGNILGAGYSDSGTSGVVNDSELYYPTGTTGPALTLKSATFNRCKIGKLTQGSFDSNSYMTLEQSTFNDCFFNTRMQHYLDTHINRGYGILTVRPRGPTTDSLTIRNSAFVAGFEGNDLINFNYHSDPTDVGGTIILVNSIVTGMTELIDAASNATRHGYVNSNWTLDYLNYYNSAIESGITAPTNSITTDPDLINPTTEVQTDYIPDTGSPSLTAGYGGGALGITGNEWSEGGFTEDGSFRIADADDAAYYDNVAVGDLILPSQNGNMDVTLSSYIDGGFAGKTIHLIPRAGIFPDRVRLYGGDMDFSANRITITNTDGVFSVIGFFAVYDLIGWHLTGEYVDGVTGSSDRFYGIFCHGFVAEEYTGGDGCSEYEINHVASRYSTASGFKCKNETSSLDITNSSIHHCQVYLSYDEGMYLGSTSGSTVSKLINFDVHNNIVSGSGLDGIQISSQWVSGRLYNNTIAPAAVNWLNAQLDNSHDYAFSLGVNKENGAVDIKIDHNVVMGTPKTGQIIFKGTGATTGNVALVDNVFQGNKNSWNWYFGGTNLEGITLELSRNTFGNNDYTYDILSSSNNDLNDAIRSHMYRIAIGGDVIVEDNIYDSSLTYARVASGWSAYYASAPNFGAGLNVTQSNNTQTSVTAFTFEDYYIAGIDLAQITRWVATINASGGGSDINTGDPVTFQIGEHVYRGDEIYKALEASQGVDPALNPTEWENLDFTEGYRPQLEATVTTTEYVTAQVGYGFSATEPDHYSSPNQQPVITISPNSFTVDVDEAYTLPIITATDAEDGNIIADTVRSGDVEVFDATWAASTSKTEGTYVGYLDVDDSESLAADQKSLTVNVVDPSSSSLTKETFMVSSTTYHAWVYRPPGYTDGDDINLWFYLHGAGELGSTAGDLDNIGSNATASTLMYDIRFNGYEPPFVVIAPQLQSGSSWPTFLAKYYLKHFLDIHTGASVAGGDIVGITGFSLGGGSSWSSIGTNDGSLSGFSDPATVINRVAPVAGHQSYPGSGAANFVGDQVWAFYGDNGSGTTDGSTTIQYGTDWTNAINSAGGDAVLDVYSVSGHSNTAAQAYSPTSGLYQWMNGEGSRVFGSGANVAPTDITLSDSDIDEEIASGSTVATISANGTPASTFSLVAGTGSTDNASFTISGTSLLSAEVFDYETKNSYSIRIRATNSEGTYEEVFTISINDTAEPVAPTDISITSTSIDENQAINTTVGTLSADGSPASTFSLVSGTGDTDNASFNISGTSLRSSESFDYETKSSYSVRVRATNTADNVEESFTITINDVAEGGGSEIAKFNFNTTTQSVSGWNDVSGHPHDAVRSATDGTTGIGINTVATANWSIFAGASSSQNGGEPGGTNADFPETVRASYHFLYSWSYGDGNMSTDKNQYQVTGLNPASTYTFTFFGSRDASDGRNTNYRVRDNEGDKTITNYVVADNTANNVQITGIVPTAGGTVQIFFHRGSSNNYGYLNGLIIEEE